MTNIIRFAELISFDDKPDDAMQEKAVNSLEAGDVLFFPRLGFELLENEKSFLTEASLDGSRKNIGYDTRIKRLHGDAYQGEAHVYLEKMIQRYVTCVEKLMEHLFPSYQGKLKTERATYRPAKVEGRKVPSYRKDDSRLHVDAFPSSPMQTNRSLRVFTNIHPEGKPRVWRVGESFEAVAKRFQPQLKKPLPGFNRMLKLCKITKRLRSDYDSLMLQLHDGMKADIEYQKKVSQQTVEFPSGSTWMVFSDQVSHAAMAGQFMLEQTFELPVSAMKHPEQSPLKVLEKLFQPKIIS